MDETKIMKDGIEAFHPVIATDFTGAVAVCHNLGRVSQRNETKKRYLFGMRTKRGLPLQCQKEQKTS